MGTLRCDTPPTKHLVGNFLWKHGACAVAIFSFLKKSDNIEKLAYSLSTSHHNSKQRGQTISPLVSQSASQSISPTASQSISPSVNQSVNQPASQSVHQPASQSISSSVHQPASQSISPSASQSISPSARQTASQSIYQSVSRIPSSLKTSTRPTNAHFNITIPHQYQTYASMTRTQCNIRLLL